jgi:uracil-DNA glycosylase
MYVRKCLTPPPKLAKSKKDPLSFLKLSCNVGQCRKCPISPLGGCSINKNIVPGQGGHSKIMVVGEAPGATEDKEGKPFVGLSGKLLTKIITEAELNRDDLFITNTIKCRPYLRNGKRISNRQPTITEMENCKYWLWEEIKLVNPQVIVTVGKIPTMVLNNLHYNSGFAMRDYFMPHKMEWEPKPTLIACWHPSYLLRKGEVEYKEAVESFNRAKLCLL